MWGFVAFLCHFWWNEESKEAVGRCHKNGIFDNFLTFYSLKQLIAPMISRLHDDEMINTCSPVPPICENVSPSHLFPWLRWFPYSSYLSGSHPTIGIFRSKHLHCIECICYTKKTKNKYGLRYVPTYFMETCCTHTNTLSLGIRLMSGGWAALLGWTRLICSYSLARRPRLWWMEAQSALHTHTYI